MASCWNAAPLYYGHFHIFLFIHKFLPVSPCFVFTESLCGGQNICVRLCVCLPLTCSGSSWSTGVEPPRLSKHASQWPIVGLL